VKYQISGRAPAIEETEEEKDKSIKLMTTQRMMQNLFGFNPSELERESDDSSDEETTPSTLQYFNNLNEEEVSKIKYLLLPEATLDRAKRFRECLCKCGQKIGKYTSFSGSRGDSGKQLLKISEWFRNCNTIFKTSKTLGLFELTAITIAIFEVSWWLSDTWHVSKGTRMTVSRALSKMWKIALSPETCQQANIDEEDKDSFITFLNEINKDWKDYSINIQFSYEDMDEEEIDDEDMGEDYLGELFDF